MIDDPEKTAQLIEELKASLPLQTQLPQTLKASLSQRSSDLDIPDRCNVTSVFYMGEEGGIACGLDIGGPETKNAHVVSITHLIFSRRGPLFRQIDAYQRHRIKKLKQQKGRSY